MSQEFATLDWDRIEGIPAPRERHRLIGHAGAEQEFLAACRSGRLHHAWLIGGPPGIGKATLAWRFARFLLAHPDPATAPAATLDVDPEARVVHRMAAGAHPDFMVLSRTWDTEKERFTTGIPVAEVRKAVHMFASTPAEGGWRIAIIDTADDMNASAANAILKLLEEPPPRSLFLILAHAPGRLLPTIRSRCRLLMLSPLSREEILQGLEELAPASVSEADRQLAAALSEGSMRRALELATADGLSLYRAVSDILQRLPQLDRGRVLRLAERVSARGAEAEFERVHDFIEAWLDRRVRGEGEPDGAPAPAVPRLACWAEVWEKVGRAARLADALNLDRKQTVLSAFEALAEATRPVPGA